MASSEIEASGEMLKSCNVPFIPESSSVYDMAISTFSQVIFPDTPDFFPPEKDITVRYILAEIEPSTRDWVGLFRVGWASPRDYSTYVWAPKPIADESGNLSQTITFQAYQLPKDDNEFYQLCYVTRQGYVRGASTPFQFRLCTENDCLVEVEDESGMIILKTKSDALEEQLSKAKEERNALESEMKLLFQAKVLLEENLKKISEELTMAQEQNRVSEEKKADVVASMEKMTEEYEKVTHRLAKAEKRIEKTKADLASAQNNIKELQESMSSLQAQIVAAEQERLQEKINYEEEIKIREMMMLEKDVQMNVLREEIKTMSTIKEEIQQKSSLKVNEQESAFKVVTKENENLRVKCQSLKDERDLFKDQFTKSELARNEALKDKASLEEKLQYAIKDAEMQQEKVDAAEEKIKVVEKQWKELNKKHKIETNQVQDELRNSSERANALEAAKKLLTQELSDTTATRDKLMAELNQIKKEKEELVEELKGANSTVRALQCQLETVEEKLNESEKALMESEKLIREERKRGELIENEMHQQILLLRKQLEESDNAVAVATSERECSTTKDQKTQTIKKKKESVQVQAVPTKVLEQEFVINDLRSQVEDLTTRLSMGADAYKEKFVECHKLEKKVKKLKMLQKPDAAPPAASKVTPAKEEEAEGVSPVNQGFMNKLEKLFLSIADPDAEEQEQSKQLQQKLDEMARGVEKEHNRYRRYKQLYAEEKHKAMTRLASANATTAEINHKYKAEKERCKVLVVENEMLKSQLDEFVRSSTDAAVRNVMTCDPTVQDRTPRETPDDEAQFQDAQEFPLLGDKADSSPSGSSETDEGLEYNGQSLNFCTKGEATSSEEKSDSDGMEIARPTSKPISIAPVGKSKVISCQPIRSPPVPSDVISSSSQSEGPSAPRTDARKKKGKGKKGKTRKTVRPVM